MNKIHITLAQLQAFATVAEVGSFTIASERLGMTQSAISHSIANLEKGLQVTLLERGNRSRSVTRVNRAGSDRTQLTEIGHRVLFLAQTMLAGAEQIYQETAAVVGLATGKVRLGSFPSVSARILPKLLRQFQQRYPGIEVMLFEGTDDEVRDWIQTRVIDVGVVALPAEGFDLFPIVADDFKAIVSAEHELADRDSVHIRQLASAPFILSKAGCGPVILDLFRRVKRVPQIQFEIADMRTLFAMVQENMGVTIAPELALPQDLTGLSVLELEPKQTRQLAFGVLSNANATPAVRAFLDSVKTSL